MIKKCNICGHTGELTWRDGKYYCAMCGTEIAETDPVVQPQPVMQTQSATTAANITCPICRNKENNRFDGSRYHCALCATTFDLQQATQAQQSWQYQQYGSTPNFASQYRIEELKKQKKSNITTGIVFVFLFWPASIYFFYKAYKTNQELKVLGY